MKSLRVAGVVAAGLALALLPACQQDSGKPKVAFVTNNPESFWTIAEAGADKAAAEADVDLLFRRPDTGRPRRPERGHRRRRQPGHQGHRRQRHRPEEPGRLPRQDRRQGAVPLTVDNDAPDTGRLCYIGTDNYEAGRAVGRLVKEAMPDGGTSPSSSATWPRSTPASGARACSTSWPATRTSRSRTADQVRQEIHALPHLYRPAGRAPRRPRKTPSPLSDRVAQGRAERLPDRPVGLQPAGDPQRRQRQGVSSARSRSSASTRTPRPCKASPTATSTAPSCRTPTSSATSRSS